MTGGYLKVQELSCLVAWVKAGYLPVVGADAADHQLITLQSGLLAMQSSDEKAATGKP